MDETDQYEEWDLSSLPIPPRSTLYALRPIGVGTPLVESLSSYITRLAEVHCIYSGALVNKLLLPLVPGYSPLKRHYMLFSEAGTKSAMFNGVSLAAVYAVEALETLTQRSDLHYLTFLPLTAILPKRAGRLLRMTKAWCPTCYEEWHLSGQPVYDPLLWFLQEVTYCSRHRQRLSIRCPYQDCAQVLPAVGWRARAGYCSYCQRWLGVASELTNEETASPEKEGWLWQEWVIQTVGEVLTFLPTCSALPERNRVQQVLVYAVQRLSEGYFSAFTRALGMQLATVHTWYQGQKLPEIAKLLQLCYRLGLSLHQMLFQEVETLQPHFNTSLLPEPLAPKETILADKVAIYQALEKILTDNEQPPPTLGKVAQQLRHAPQTLYSVHPTACRAIVARYKAYVQQQKEARLQRFQEEIQQVVLRLRSEGLPLTQKRISPFLSQPGILRDPRLRSFLNEICRELA